MKWIEIWAMLKSIGIIVGIVLNIILLIIYLVIFFKNNR